MAFSKPCGADCPPQGCTWVQHCLRATEGEEQILWNVFTNQSTANKEIVYYSSTLIGQWLAWHTHCMMSCGKGIDLFLALYALLKLMQRLSIKEKDVEILTPSILSRFCHSLCKDFGDRISFILSELDDRFYRSIHSSTITAIGQSYKVLCNFQI